MTDKLDIRVVILSGASILIIGLTGAGKTKLIYNIVKEAKSRYKGGGSTFFQKVLEFPIYTFAPKLSIKGDYRDYERYPEFKYCHKHAVKITRAFLKKFEECAKTGGIIIVDDLHTQITHRNLKTARWLFNELIGMHRHYRCVLIITAHNLRSFPEEIQDMLRERFNFYVFCSRAISPNRWFGHLDIGYRRGIKKMINELRPEEEDYVAYDVQHERRTPATSIEDIIPLFDLVEGKLRMQLHPEEKLRIKRITTYGEVLKAIKENPNKRASEIAEIVGTSAGNVNQIVWKAKWKKKDLPENFRFPRKPITKRKKSKKPRPPSPLKGTGMKARIIALYEANPERPRREIAEELGADYNYASMIISRYKKKQEVK